MGINPPMPIDERAHLKIIIDAYNLLGKSAIPWTDPTKEEILIELIKTNSKSSQNIIAVFDGKRSNVPWGQQFQDGHIRVIFTPSTETADHWIIETITTHPTPAQLTIVSSDLEIISVAKRYRCKSIRAETWINQQTRWTTGPQAHEGRR